MSESKNKVSFLISVNLTPSQRVTINSILNFIRRCGTCGTIATQGDGALQIKRFSQIMVDLDLISIDDSTREEQDKLTRDNTSSKQYEMKLETARHLQSILDTKIRYNMGGAYILALLTKSLEDQVPKSASEMDAEATAVEKPPMASFLLTISPDERHTLLEVFFSPNLCLSCASISDGPKTRKDVYLFASSFTALKLPEIFDKTIDEINASKKENPDSFDIQLTLDEANYLHDMLFHRVGLVPKAPRKLATFLKCLEEIKGGTYERKAPLPQ